LPKLRALVFDAYGTLFDVHSIAASCEALWPGAGQRLSSLWRTKQLEYTWQLSLMRHYRDFGSVTEDALRYACAALGLSLGEQALDRLRKAYLVLSPFPEVGEVLAALQKEKLRLAILSNGSPAMLLPLVKNAGMRDAFRAVISVDAVRIYKPAPAVYRLAVQKLGAPKSAIGFVSSNGWDACGAKAFGFRTFWVNRGGAPLDALGPVPDQVIEDLRGLPAAIRSR
jgi:2-haloacid dehalogenase